MTANVLSLEGVCARYARAKGTKDSRKEDGRSAGSAADPELVLAGVSFQVSAGEVVGLIGPNGAGKSTLLRCVLGLHPLQAGRVRVLEQDVNAFERRALARTIAYVPQHSGSSMSQSVIDMVALGRAPHRGLHPAAHERAVVFDAIERLQLQPLAMRPFGELSGGQRQRVLLARALAQQGRMLVLDEPTSDLDLRHQIAALGAVRRLADEQGTAALIAIHDLSLAGRYCDRLVLLHQGRVHAQGSWQAVLTPENFSEVYGVSARIGTDGGRPYVLTEAESDADRAAEASPQAAPRRFADVEP
ncbi:MAG: ABC transporter ATP-binding protein [Hydrogenophaga sp.]|uniref:ABC transporter ATP-binding protein n=1 Tax=Hydrogenophaga sp. TaxID=1904254 RepID=UPI002ABB4F0D|nr:ABC transporter ATP-binding protein [Hydrogenophaga sp.]MDZ4282957.1 ABC transporter ATP-binding protein [Hydrogenophaga sp.]